MAGLLEPYIPDAAKWQQSAMQGYQFGNAIRSQNLLQSAGQAAAAGNMGEAKNMLYGGGDFATAQKMDTHKWAGETHQAAMDTAARAASTDQLTRALKVQSELANLADAIKTPEEFEAAKIALGKTGLDIGKYTFQDLPTLRNMALTVKDRLELEVKQREKAEYGLNPIYGVDASGKPVVMQLGKTGKLMQPEIPSGITITKPAEYKDVGTGYQVFNKITNKPTDFISKNNTEEAAQKQLGKLQGEARQQLTSAERSADAAIGVINELKTHPGLDMGVGGTSYLPAVRGTDYYDFNAKLTHAKAQTFMQAREALKGAGAVTDFEGEKGERAIANLDQAQSKEQFLRALNDLEKLVQASKMDLRKKTGLKAGGGAEQNDIIDLSGDLDGTQYAKIPSGTRFIAPDGSERIKP